jgi:hypothetical protein
MTFKFDKILVALFLASTIGQIHWYAQAEERNDAASADAQIAKPQHIVIDEINAQTSQQAAAKKQEEKEQREEQRKNIELALTVAIAAAATFQALCSFLQWKIYKAQLKTSMPLVVIDWENLIHLPPPDPDPTPGSRPMVHHFHWTMRNVGQTPAFVTEYSARFVIVPTSKGVSEMKYAPPKPYIGEPLFTEPKPVVEMLLYTRLEDDRAYEQIEGAYRSGAETLYAFGYVKFKDRYGMRHSSKFCYRYYGWQTLRHDYDGFGIAKDKKNEYI